jgi:hypothetical protein
MKKGLCSKHFPKEFQPETIIDENGFALYRHRNNGRRVFKNGQWLDNRLVVPYNMTLLKKYQGHMNVECRPGHSVLTENSVRFLRFFCNSGYKKWAPKLHRFSK